MYAHRRDGGARLISSLHTSPDARACASSVYRPRRRRHTRAERSLCIWACRAPSPTLEHKSKCFFFEDFEPHLPFKQQRRQPALSPRQNAQLLPIVQTQRALSAGACRGCYGITAYAPSLNAQPMSVACLGRDRDCAGAEWWFQDHCASLNAPGGVNTAKKREERRCCRPYVP